MAEERKADVAFKPEALDPAIANAIDRLDKVVVDIERIRGAAEPLLDRVRARVEKLLAETPLDVPQPELAVALGSLVDQLERYARVALNLTKVIDEGARLRSFVAGGADSRPDVSGMSSVELSELVKKGAAGL